MPILKVKNKITGLWEDIPYIKGEKGEKGDTGERGPQGIQGEQGVQGIQGDQGIPGVQGPIGLTGPQGVQGEKGDKGDTGAVPIFTVGSTTTLPPGSAPSINIDSTDPENPVMEIGIPKGDTGAKGDKGDKGDTGDTGPAPSFTVGTTSSLPAGSAPAITIDSSDPAHLVMDFGIPAGAKGDKGDKGDTGAAGQDGADGADGTDGQDGVSPSVTVTEISGGHNVEITDAQGTTDFDVMDGEVSEEELETALIDKADVITSSASGEIVTIADGADNLPIKGMTIQLLPVQSGSGDPSPDNVRPISGWTGVEVYQSGKNMLDNQLVSGTYNGCTITKNADGSITVSGTPSAQTRRAIHSGAFWDGKYFGRTSFGTFPSGTRVFARRTAANGTVTYPTLNTNNLDENAVYDQLTLEINTSYGGTPFTIYPQIELGLTATAYEPYNGNTYPISWQSSAGTVYGGSLDVTSGVLTVTDAMITSYNGETLPSTWISDRDVYAPGTTPTTGAQVVYKLATPTTYQLTPTQISTLLGTNNFWSNSNGSIDLEYRADTKLYIQQLTKPSEDDMVANANIASGRFFMVGSNALYLSTVAIAQGEKIIEGTNCTRISLADALNQINV